MRGWLPWVFVGIFFLGWSNLFLIILLAWVGSQLANLGRTWTERSRFLARERAQLANPADFDARHRLGEIHLRGGQLKKAEGYLEDALRVMRASPVADPDPDLMLDCACTRLRRGRTEDASSLFEETLAIAPEHPRALLWAGRAALKLGDTGTARRHWEAAAVRSPSDAGVHFRLARLLAAAGETDRARELLDEHRNHARNLPGFARRRNFWWTLAIHVFPLSRRIPLG